MTHFDFPYIRRSYPNRRTPENLALNANLQDFAKQVRCISELVNIGQLSLEEACDQIEIFLEQLKRSKKYLRVDK